jgi:hypothetical protein
MDKRERKLKRENWLERNHEWYYPFKGFLYAGIILLVTHEAYEYIKSIISSL